MRLYGHEPRHAKRTVKCRLTLELCVIYQHKELSMFANEIINNTVVSLSFPDRLRVLLGRKIRIRVNIKTENVIGNIETTSTTWVDKIYAPRQAREVGYGETDA